MKQFILKTLLVTTVAMTAMSAHATLADRKSDLGDFGGSKEAVSSPYSGQKVIRGQIVGR